MIPLTDVIRPRTRPVVTAALLVGHALVFAFLSEARWMQLVWGSLYLWLFGHNVEDRLGRTRFAALYLAAGALGAAAALATGQTAPDPLVAAGGAVSGVLGAYVVLYPHSRVLALVPVPVLLVEVPAVFFLALWLAVLFLAGQGLMTAAGLLAGAALARPLQRPERQRVEWWAP